MQSVVFEQALCVLFSGHFSGKNRLGLGFIVVEAMTAFAGEEPTTGSMHLMPDDSPSTIRCAEYVSETAANNIGLRAGGEYRTDIYSVGA